MSDHNEQGCAQPSECSVAGVYCDNYTGAKGKPSERPARVPSTLDVDRLHEAMWPCVTLDRSHVEHIAAEYARLSDSVKGAA